MQGASKTPPTVGQVETTGRFKRAITYATSIIKDLTHKLMYGAATKGDQSAFNVAMKDAFTPPQVTVINKSGYKGLADDKIFIEATDDFKVTAVKVIIHDPAGDLVEQGDAVLEINGLKWLYTPTSENDQAIGSKIKATAFDHAGNEGSLEITV